MSRFLRGIDPAVKIGDVNLRLWQAFIVLFPLYLLPSGMPRISDFFILAIIVRLLAKGKAQIRPEAKHLMGILLIFVLYVFGINLFHAYKEVSFQFLQSSLFYLYNMAYFWVAMVMYAQYGRRFLEATLNAMLLSVAWQVPFAILELGSNSVRKTLFFNNPNQLGYYTLLAACFVAYLGPIFRLSPLKTTGAFGVILFLSLLSLSKAAMAGVAIIVLIYALRQPRIAVAVTIGMAVLLVALPAGNRLATNAVIRLSGVGTQNDDNAEGRGYDRIWLNPHYLAMGAGEGDYKRFNVFGGKELHSVFGTLLFSYGIPGFTLAMLFIYLVLRGQGVHVWPMLPVGIYGLTHQGLRFTLLWGVLAIAWCAWDYQRRILPQEERPPREPVPGALPA